MVVETLRSEAEIMRTWPRGEPPVVSVVCTTYNHERYIEQALVGFLAQETRLPFEVVIHDDLSSDRTREVVDAYAARYPNIIRTIYQTQNQYSLGRTSALVAFGYCSTKYIAFCEGDDYWTDARKLQLQIDVLEEDPTCALVFHNARLLREAKGNDVSEIACLLEKDAFTLEDIILRDWFIPSHSMMFRRHLLPDLPWLHRVFGLDYAMHLLLANSGDVRYIDRVMGVYRVNAASISGNRPAGFFQIKLMQTLSYFNFHTQFAHDKTVAMRLDRERGLMYVACLSGRPWYIRALSLDYLRFKLDNLMRRRLRRRISPRTA